MSFNPMNAPLRVSTDVVMNSAQENRRRRRATFILFLNTFLHYLDGIVSREMCEAAKEIIRLCLKRNRQRNPRYHNLMHIILVKLRQFVGEDHWLRSSNLFRVYIQDLQVQHDWRQQSQIPAESSGNTPFVSPTRSAMINSLQQFEMFDDLSRRNLSTSMPF